MNSPTGSTNTVIHSETINQQDHGFGLEVSISVQCQDECVVVGDVPPFTVIVNIWQVVAFPIQRDETGAADIILSLLG